MNKFFSLLPIAVLLMHSGPLEAQELDPAFYAGIAGGLGSTTWSGLVPIPQKQNRSILLSTPSTVDEGGTVYGFFGGYDFTPYFGLELVYLKFPDAEINFSRNSLFAYAHTKRTQFFTSTASLGLLAKVMLTIPQTPFRIFSAAGISKVFRKDELLETTKNSPTFSVGLTYNMTKHLMTEFAFNYTAGYGEAELNACNSYVPFLYSGTMGLAYRF